MKLKLSIILILTFFAFDQLFAQLIEAQNYGGKTELKRIIEQEMVYPAEALKQGIEGTVGLTFEVSELGEVEKIRITRSVNPAIDNEAIRLLKLLLWDAARLNGTATRTENAIPFTFSIKKYQKAVKERGYEVPENFIAGDNLENFKVYDYDNIQKQPLPDLDNNYDNLTDYISRNINYPSEALKNDISGYVKLKFVVEPSGKITNIKEVKPLGSGCSGESIRLLKTIKWKAGLMNEKPARTVMQMNFNFNLLGGVNGNPSGANGAQ